MYFNDHSPPHFHTDYQGYKALYEIQTLDVLEGGLPKRAHALVLEWASMHKKELLGNWGKAIVPAAMEKIEPLD